MRKRSLVHGCFVVLTLLGASACTSDTTVAPTPALPSAPPVPTLTLSALTATNVGSNATCNVSGGQATQIDEIAFAFDNSTGVDLANARVQREGSTAALGTVGVCTQDLCQAAFELTAPSTPTACLTGGAATTARSGQIHVFTRQAYRPTETYRLQLTARLPDATTLRSNVVEASVVRMPGGQNDHVGFVSFTPEFGRSGSDYTPTITVSYYRPSFSGNRLVQQFLWYNRNGLFAVRTVNVSERASTILTVRESQLASVTGPWTVVVKFRETVGSPGTDTVSTCNNDRPTSEGRCVSGVSDQMPPATGAIWTDLAQTVTVG